MRIIVHLTDAAREYAYDRASCFSRNTARPGQPHPRPKSPLGISINLATLTTATSKRIKLHPCEQYCSEMHAIGDHYHPQRTAVGSEASLGLEFDPFNGEIRLRNPRLPAFLDEVILRNLQLGQSSVDVRVRRRNDTVFLDTSQTNGDIRVSIVLTR
jgi:hypothetical protein